jgi:hypothetical protein
MNWYVISGESDIKLLVEENITTYLNQKWLRLQLLDLHPFVGLFEADLEIENHDLTLFQGKDRQSINLYHFLIKVYLT